MKIAPEVWQQIAEERRRRDHAAYMIGVATHEWRELVGKNEVLISESRDRERRLGENALRVCGLNPDAQELRIMDDGSIMELVAGQYRAIGEGEW